MLYKDIILSDNPIAYYLLDETSGRIAFDLTDNNHDGTYVGFSFFQSQFGTSFLGPSLGIGGTSYITVPNFTIDFPLSFEFWYKKTSSNHNGIIFSKFDKNVGEGFSILSNASNNIAFRYTPGYFLSSLDQYPYNIWHYVVITIDSDIIFYVDGIQLMSYVDHNLAIINNPEITESLDNNEPLLIGTDTVNYFQGNLMHIAIYDYALSSIQINNHRNTAYMGNITRFIRSNFTGGIIG